MIKKIFTVSFLSIMFLTIPVFTANAMDFDNAFRAIVKIYTYYENNYGDLEAVQTGSGVIINSEGAILTNHHVVHLEDIFGDELLAAYKICLTKYTDQEPECIYSADLIASDEDKDIAILKIRNIGLSSETSYSYLGRANSKIYEDGDVVEAIGYPSAGGNTITGALGTISGTTESNSLNWIKTSALVSFGSSGGALIDLNGKLLGITSAANSDLGYAIDITSINSWIGQNINKEIKPSTLKARMDKFIKEQDALDSTNEFVNTLPDIKITKPENWEFRRENEGSIIAFDKENNNTGFITISWSPTDNLFEPVLDVTVDGVELSKTCFSAGDVTISNIVGRKMVCPSSGEEAMQIFIPSKNYGISIYYYYGKDDQDKSTIDNMLDNLVITENNNDFSIQKSFEYTHPDFEINLPEDWSLMSVNSVAMPIAGQKISVPEIGFAFFIREITDNMKVISNESYFNYISDNELIKSDYEDSYSLKADRYFLDSNYKINNELTNEIFYKYRFKDEDNGDAVKAYAAGFRVRDNDRVIVIKFSYLGEEEQEFEKYLQEFIDQVLSKLTLGREVTEEVVEDNSVDKFQEQTQEQIQEQKQSVSAGEDKSLIGRLRGRILLQVQDHGEAWYVNPKDDKRYYMANGEEAYKIMRYLGVGITNKDLDRVMTDKNFAKKHSGKIFLKVEALGEAYYIDIDGNAHYLKDGAAAYTIMRELGLGITNDDLTNILASVIN